MGRDTAGGTTPGRDTPGRTATDRTATDRTATDRTARGVLYPTRLPTFHRLPAPGEAADLVEWFWFPRWELDPGRTSRQQIIAHPACNLVIEAATSGPAQGATGHMVLTGPSTRISHRDLTGSGWAVGALLRPAAISLLDVEPAAILDSGIPMDDPDLCAAVAQAMAHADPERGRSRAAAHVCRWLGERGSPSAEALAANRVFDLLTADPSVIRLADAAAALAMSPRTLQRVTRRYLGVTPAQVIRRRRLQEAAERVRADPGIDLAAVAAELGYSDQAHLARDFRRTLGFSATDYRRGLATPAS